MLKQKELNPILMSQYNAMRELTEFENNDNLKSLFSRFSEVYYIADAKRLLKELFPESEGKSAFSINGVEIKIVSKDDIFCISADFDNEHIAYLFGE